MNLRFAALLGLLSGCLAAEPRPALNAGPARASSSVALPSLSVATSGSAVGATTKSDSSPGVSPQEPPQPEPSAAEPELDRDGLFGSREDRPSPPPVVAEEAARMAKLFREFPPLHQLPAKVGADQLERLVPVAHREDFRRELEQHLAGGGNRIYSDRVGAYDILFIDVDGLSKLLLTFDINGKLRWQLTLSRAQPPRRGNVITHDAKLESKSPVDELFFTRITSMSVCCLPESVEVYRLTPQGALIRVLSEPRAHFNVGPGVRYEFMRGFSFDLASNSLSIRDLYPLDAKPRVNMVYLPAKGRYVKRN